MSKEKPPKGPDGKDLITDSSDLLDAAGVELAKAEQRGEIQVAAVLAKKFPRDEAKCREELMAVCKLSEFAGSIDDPTVPAAYYSYERGKKKVGDEWIPNIVSGPSVKLAREAARIFGNIRDGFLITHDDEEDRSVVGSAWDLQKNLSIHGSDSFKKLIQRRQKEGGTKWETANERDLRELTTRRAAILIRNSLLGLFPGYLINQAVKICKETVSRAQSGETTQTLAQRIDRMIGKFSYYKITKKQIATYLHKPISKCTDDDLANLFGIYESIKDNMISFSEREEMFGPGESVPSNDLKETGLNQANFRSKKTTDPGDGGKEKKTSQPEKKKPLVEEKKKTPPGKKTIPAKESVTPEMLIEKMLKANKANYMTVKAEVIKLCKHIQTTKDIIKVTNAMNAQARKFFPKA